MKIAIEEVRLIMTRIHEINMLPLEDITWTKNGIELDIPQALVDSFGFTGLSNINFITTGYYKQNEGDK